MKRALTEAGATLAEGETLSDTASLWSVEFILLFFLDKISHNGRLAYLVKSHDFRKA